MALLHYIRQYNKVAICVKVEQEKRASSKSFVPVKDSLLTTFGTGSHFDCVLRTTTLHDNTFSISWNCVLFIRLPHDLFQNTAYRVTRLHDAYYVQLVKNVMLDGLTNL